MGSRIKGFLARYHVLISMGVVAWVMELSYGLMGQSALPPYIQHIGQTEHIGWVYAVFLVTETMFRSPMGALGDIVGRRPLIILSALVSSVTSLGISLTSSLWIILALRFVDGVGSASIWTTMLAVMSTSVGPQRTTTAMGAFTVAYMAGVGLGPLMGGLANDLTGSKQSSFYLVTAMFLATAIAAYVLVPEGKERLVPAISAERRPTFDVSEIMLAVRALPDYVLLAFLAFISIGLIIPIAKLFAMNVLGMSETFYGALVVPVALIVGLFSLASGPLGDRWGKARSVHLGLVISTLGMWIVANSRLIWEFALACVVVGIGLVLAMPAWLAVVADMTSESKRGAMIGGLGTAHGVGAIIGTTAASYLYAMGPVDILGHAIPAHYLPLYSGAVILSVSTALSFFSVRVGETRRVE